MKNDSSFSRIIAGAMTWGQWGKGFAKKDTSDLIAYCVDLGLTTFDHADIYGGYTTEADFGRGLVHSPIKREDIQLISKCGIQFDSKVRANAVKHYNYSKAYIIWSVERSLKELNTDYLDLLLLHRPSPLLEPEEINEAILQLQNDGKILNFGVSNFRPSHIRMLETTTAVLANQVEFSLTANEVMYNGTLDDCIENRRLAMSWSPLGSYFKENNAQTSRIREALNPLKEKYNASEDQLLLAWVLKHPAKVHPVVGTATKSRLKDAFKATEITMELEDWFVLLAASQGHEVP